MNINKDSWHYKLVDYFDHDVAMDLDWGHSVTLCTYFWSVVGALFKAVALLISGAILGAMLLTLLVSIFCSVMYLLLPLTGPVLEYRLYGIGLQVLVIGLLVFTVIGFLASLNGDVDVVPSWMKSSKPAEEKQPSLLWSWIKAKKDKVCPLLKLED